jgi:macrolide transport system ATP-binding/permease protein
MRHDDLDEEIRSHLAMAEQDRIAGGADRESARLAALKEFGNVPLVTEDARMVWSSRWIEAARDLLSDVRYGMRALRKGPGFSLIVIAVLALGIGLNAAVFTLFKSLALKPLSGVADSGSLGVLMARTSAGRQVPLSYPDYVYVRDHSQVFAGLSGSSMTTTSLGLGNRGERVWAELVTGNYFQMLGVRAILGRTLLPSDELAPGKHPVVVLSHGLWRRSFGGDAAIIGKTIHLNGQPLTVVGVAEPAFHGTVVSMDMEAFVPLMMAPQVDLAARTRPDLLHDRTPFLMVLGRLRPGTTLAEASAEAPVLSSRLAVDAPLTDLRKDFLVLPIWESPYGAQTYMLPAVIVVGGTGVLLLLIVCANLAGLVLVRGVARRGEIALRLAIGAGRLRILRLLLVENLVLAVPGAALGLLMSWVALPLLLAGASAGAPSRLFLDLSVDWTVIAFAGVAALISALVFGLVPALSSSRIDLISVIKEDLSPRGAVRGRFRGALVVAQVAVSLLLLVGAGLMARSLEAARNADPGFVARNVVSLTVDPAAQGYDEARGRVFYERLLDAARADASIESASLARTFPMSLVDGMRQTVAVEGYQPQVDEDLVFLFNVVAPDYFRTLQIDLVTGRDFERRDDPSSTPVVIVNETLARRFWNSTAHAIGKRVRVSGGEWRTVIGVARDVKYARINEDPRPYVYLPFLQSYTSNMMLQARGPAGPVALLEQAQRHIQSVDPELPILDARTLADQAAAGLNTLALAARMLFMFGIAAMSLAALGIYGMVSYTVKQSTHEIGIRMAVGAGRQDILRRFLGRGLRLGLTGAAIGLVSAIVVTRLLSSVLYGVSATDVISFAGAFAVVVGVVLAASLAPAWKAARTNPVAALRHQ